MPKAQAIQINWQFTGSAGIMQVEHTADCVGGAWFKSPLSTEVWHPHHIWWETAFQFAEVLALNGIRLIKLWYKLSVASAHYIASIMVVTAIYNLCSWLIHGSLNLTKFLLCEGGGVGLYVDHFICEYIWYMIRILSCHVMLDKWIRPFFIEVRLCK